MGTSSPHDTARRTAAFGWHNPSVGLRLRSALTAAVLACAAACGGSSPAAPSPGPSTQVPSPGGPVPPPGTHILTGAIVNALDDSGAGAASFTVNGTLLGSSQASGAFSVGFPASGSNPLTLAATGFVTRETSVTAPAANLRLSLIPASFDLPSFDQMFRHSSGNRLTRWKQPPAIMIERRTLQFNTTSSDTVTALDETMSGAEVDALVADLLLGYSLLTADRLGPITSVASREAAPGAAVGVRTPGTIVITRQRGLTASQNFWGYARWSLTADGEVTGGVIILDADFEKSNSPFRRSLRMHELGHTLGCQHVSLPVRSVMNSNAVTEPNDFDRAAARLAMLRQPGNRSPDIDPASLSATTAARTPRAVTWYGAH